MNTHTSENNGRWVLYAFLGFFAVFCAVDAYFVYRAITTHTGVVTKNSYYKGLDYNKNLAEAQRQKDSGVVGKAIFSNGELTFTLKDRAENAIENARVTVNIIRPVQSGYDFSIVLEAKGQGIYSAKPSLPLKGLWQAQIEATWEQQRYKTTLRYVQP